MRQLDPKIAKDRKERVLQWVVHNHIRTSRPIASSIISEEAGLELSSATIRSILKELEEEGYLHQPHTSAGRVPTDRGYRAYVDYLENVQRLASEEKEQLESQYKNRLEELDRLLSQTSRLLSSASHSAGLVLCPKVESQTLKRLELISLGGSQVLAILVTQTGQVRHWPIELPAAPLPHRLQMLNRFLNDRVGGKSLKEVQAALGAQIQQAERELRELQTLSAHVLRSIEETADPQELFLEGVTSVVAHPEELGDLSEMRSMIRVLEERRALAGLLQDEFQRQLESAGRGERGVRVSIGEENLVPELKHLSLVTTTYRRGDQVVGLLGILGTKRMEYSRMMSLVDYMAQLVSRTLEVWDDDSGVKRAGLQRLP